MTDAYVPAPRHIRRAAHAKTDGRCWYCGTREAGSVEHQLPKNRGGVFSEDNCVMSCRSCNSKKRRLTVREFKVYLLVVEGRPPTPFYGEDPKPPERDWLIVCNNPIARPGLLDLRDERMAAYGAW